MTQIRTLLWQASLLFINLFSQPDWRNIVDILILTILIYNVIKLAVNTRASSLLKGIFFVLALAWLADALEITAVKWLLQQLVSMGLIVLVIVFQPELRRALDQIGRSRWMRRLLGIGRHQASPQARKHAEEIVLAMEHMSRKRIGALIVLERNTGLQDVTESGTLVDAEISAPLIENIFEPNTPLHDGAMIIRDERIDAAACILQLSENKSIARELGTRHRAAIGITEATDAVSLIVSEETGTMSVARGGAIERGLDAKALTALLVDIFDPQDNVRGRLMKAGKDRANEG